MVEEQKALKMDIGLVGIAAVGKTSLIRRYCFGESVPASRKSTIGLEKETITMEIEGR